MTIPAPTSSGYGNVFTWKAGKNLISDFSECEGCIASVQEYDLDNEPGDETLLKLSDGPMESFRYLVFKHQRNGKWSLLGHVDAWGKYKDSQSIVLASGGHYWLVIQGQSASGSGVALYENRIFSVSDDGYEGSLLTSVMVIRVVSTLGRQKDLPAESYRVNSQAIRRN